MVHCQQVLVARAAARGGWGDAAAWLRESEAFLAASGYHRHDHTNPHRSEVSALAIKVRDMIRIVEVDDWSVNAAVATIGSTAIPIASASSDRYQPDPGVIIRR
jgi:hypothetical protein